jgi:hypothetical protein
MKDWPFLLILISGVLVFDEVRGCYCVTPTPQEAYRGSEVVFVGMILDTLESREPIPKRYEDHPQIFRDLVDHTFLVKASWKGVDRDTIIVRTETSSSCGFQFHANTEYLVYASTGRDGLLWSGMCSRSQDIEEALADRVLLGPPRYHDPNFQIAPLTSAEVFDSAVNGGWRISLNSMECLALWETERPAIMSRLRAMDASDRPESVLVALEIYQRMQDRAGAELPAIKNRLRDDRPIIREKAMGTMAWVADQDSLFPYLIGGLRDCDASVQKAAANCSWRAIGHLSESQNDVLLESLIEMGVHNRAWYEPFAAVERFGATACDFLPRLESVAANHNDERIRQKAGAAAWSIRYACEKE